MSKLNIKHNLSRSMENSLKYCFGVVSIISFIAYANVARAFPEECSDMTAPAVFIESANLVCLQKIKVIDSSGTQIVKAALQWLGSANPSKFRLISVESDIAAENNSPYFSVQTGTLTMPMVNIPKIFGTERYSANFILSQENNLSFFELIASSVYINPDFVPNTTWKPYGMLNPGERRAVDLLGRSIPYAKIADAVYDFDNVLVDTWDLIEEESKSSGMQAAVYSDQDTGDLVLAFRGTETCSFPCSFKETGVFLLDAAADTLLTFGEDGPQFKHAFNFAEEVISRYPDRKIIVTGHSLGGGLAQAVGAVFGLETFAFNSAPVPKDFFKKRPIQLSSEELDDIIHVIADIHDPVSNTDETGKFYLNASHASPLIQFDFDEEEIIPNRLAKLKDLRLDRHDITNLIDKASSLLTIYHDGW